MHSPKFSEKVKTLSSSINATNLSLSWKGKVRNDLKRQIIPDPIEYLDFHINVQAVCASIASEIQSGSYIPSHVTRVRAEKSKGLCRLLVIPDARDALVLQVLADVLWVELKKSAPSDKAFYAPKDHAFSKPKRGLEDEYGPIGQWLKFQKEILGFTSRHNLIIVTDIANYYDWIRYSGLRSVLNDLLDTKEVVLDILIYVLKAMIWRPDYMPNDDLGLPQCDFDAPRMLAHTFLYEIDGLLRDYPGIEFARYMDDIDIGVNNLAEAKKVLRDLDLTLQSRHIRLNSGKTKILDIAEAKIHFCVSENNILDLIENKLDKISKIRPITKVDTKIIPYLSTRYWKNKTFEKGNGEKILKRLVNYSKKYDCEFNYEIFKYFFLNSPSMRETFLRYISRSSDPVKFLIIIKDALQSGEIVDDVTELRIANALVTAKWTKKIPSSLLSDLMMSFDQKKPFSLLSAMLLASRFGNYKDIRKMIDGGEYIWRQEPVVARCVAGFIPYFRGHRDYRPVRARAEKVGGRPAGEVINFLETHVFGPDFGKVTPFLRAPNPSYKNGITHAKFGMIYGLLSNGDITKQDKAKFMLKHTALRQDYYYRTLIDAKFKSIP